MFKSRRLTEVVAIWLLKLKKFQMLGEEKKMVRGKAESTVACESKIEHCCPSWKNPGEAA